MLTKDDLRNSIFIEIVRLAGARYAGTAGEASGWANGAYQNIGLQSRSFRDGMWMRKGWRCGGCCGGVGDMLWRLSCRRQERS